jgi:NAD(P)H-hydrate epimerase
MQYLMTVDKMKEIDRYSIEEIGIPALVLMERAALFVAEAAAEVTKKDEKILAVCGMGNNGGDGVAAARILIERGFTAEILLVGEEKKASREMKTQLSIAEKLNIPIWRKESFDEYNKIKEYATLLDGLFGIGLSREVGGDFFRVIEKINAGSHHVISIDIPSGIHGNTGKIEGVCIRADKTVTFGYGKPGLFLYPGCEYTGKVVVAPIGFPKKVEEWVGPDCFSYTKEDLTKLPERKAYSNKGSYGKLLVVGGAKGMSGACILSAKAALKSGAGLVRIVACEENRKVIQTSLSEAMFSPWEELTTWLSWADAVVLGPGLSKSQEALELFSKVWASEKPLVLDADGLNLLAQQGGLDYSNSSNKSKVIFTPHLKEMERLTKEPVEHLRENLLEVSRHYGQKERILVLKDARTVVSDGKKVYLNTSGNHSLAKGGSGDVLSGIIGGLLVQGAEPFLAASLGVFVHGLAAEHFTETKSGRSLLAGELTEELQWVLP